MSDRKLQIQVGVLFLVSVAVLVWGVLWFKEYRIGGENYYLDIQFGSTSGLFQGDAVEVLGVSSGKVETIRFEDGRALVTARIERHVTLYENAEFAIRSVGMMGQKIVAIDPGTEEFPPLPLDEIAQGNYESGISDLMAGVGGTLGAVEKLAVRVDSLLATVSNKERNDLSATLGHVERLTGDLAEFMQEYQDDLGASVRNLRRASDELAGLLEGREDQLGRLLDDTSTAAAKLDTTLTDLSRTMERVESILGTIESGEGTLGRVVNDAALYDSLVVTMQSARELMEDIRENPRRYFKVSVF